MALPTVLGACLLVGALSACGHGGSRGPAAVGHGEGASCAAPQLAARPFRVAPTPHPVVVRRGERLRVYGRFYTRDCFDSGPSAGTRDRPVGRVVLELVDARGRSSRLAVAHPSGPATAFAVTVRVPRSAVAGTARIVGRPLGGSLVVRVRSRAN